MSHPNLLTEDTFYTFPLIDIKMIWHLKRNMGTHNLKTGNNIFFTISLSIYISSYRLCNRQQMLLVKRNKNYITYSFHSRFHSKYKEKKHQRTFYYNHFIYHFQYVIVHKHFNITTKNFSVQTFYFQANILDK